MQIHFFFLLFEGNKAFVVLAVIISRLESCSLKWLLIGTLASVTTSHHLMLWMKAVLCTKAKYIRYFNCFRQTATKIIGIYQQSIFDAWLWKLTERTLKLSNEMCSYYIYIYCNLYIYLRYIESESCQSVRISLRKYLLQWNTKGNGLETGACEECNEGTEKAWTSALYLAD